MLICLNNCWYDPSTITWLNDLSSLIPRYNLDANNLSDFRVLKKSVKLQGFVVHRSNKKNRYKWKYYCGKLLIKQPNCIYRFSLCSLCFP